MSLAGAPIRRVMRARHDAGRQSEQEMTLPVLGGTVLLGRHGVQAALAAGHRVTIFNRGRSGPTLFCEVETLLGDRGGDDASSDPTAKRRARSGR